MTNITDKALLPAGMQDGLPPEAAHEADASARLVAHFDTWGYARVKPPLMEFEENLLGGTGKAVSAQAFRLQDPVSQRMLALRPDMTVQIARIAQSRLSNTPRPLRLAYSGEVVRVKGSQLRPEREFGQVGAELIGAPDPAGDVEIVLMAVEALSAIGIEGLSIDLGLPTLAPAVTAVCDLSDTQARELRIALNRKDSSGVKALADALGDDVSAALTVMLDAVGPANTALAKLSRLNLGEAAAAELKHLSAVTNGIVNANPDIKLTIDPVENRGFEYHTGITYAVFARAAGSELGRGGRYSVGRNGETEHATGLTLFMDTVMQALPDAEARQTVFLPWGTSAGDAQNLRAEGWRTVAALSDEPDAKGEARRLNCTHLLEGGKVRVLN